MQLQKVIEELGYSEKEAKVYLAALSLYESHVSDIAERVGLPRSSVQVIVDKLHKDGLMHFYVQRRYKYWVAENPERLLSDLRRREEAMRNAMPVFTELRKEAREKRRGGNIKIGEGLGPLRALADASGQPLLITNERVEIEYVNSAWEEQFGYSLREVRGRNPRIFQSGKTDKAVYERMWETLKAGKLFQSDALIDKRKNGTTLNLLTSIFPVRQSGRIYYIQILDDITEKKSVRALQKKFSQV